MAGITFFALFDDIASVLDDVSVMSKLAVKKTAGVLGDDLALNAQQVTGMNADRELPVVWAVAKGSFMNKLILVPAALLISAFLPAAVTPLLMVGGAFLCYEGFEKVAHKLLHRHESGHASPRQEAEAANPQLDLQAYEKTKIRGAVRTDFILSAEIIAITLGVVANASLLQQVLVLSGIALLMTVGVYELVAGIIKLDDLGLYLSKRASSVMQWLGASIVTAAPYLMRTLTVVGTIAMFMVGGGILVHGVAALHHVSGSLVEMAGGLPVASGAARVLAPVLFSAVVGFALGAILNVVVGGIKKLLPRG